jgi:hypothetical protein
VQLGLGRRLALPPGRTPPVLPEEHFEEIANTALLNLLREGVMQRELGIDLVDVSPATSLANDVAVLDQFRDDAMCASLRDPHGLSDITQANAGVVGNAEHDLSVVGEELVLGHLIRSGRERGLNTDKE